MTVLGDLSADMFFKFVGDGKKGRWMVTHKSDDEIVIRNDNERCYISSDDEEWNQEVSDVFMLESW